MKTKRQLLEDKLRPIVKKMIKEAHHDKGDEFDNLQGDLYEKLHKILVSWMKMASTKIRGYCHENDEDSEVILDEFFRMFTDYGYWDDALESVNLGQR